MLNGSSGNSALLCIVLFEERIPSLVLFNSFEAKEVLLMLLIISFTNLMVRGRKLMNSSVIVECQTRRFVFRNRQHTVPLVLLSG